MDDTWNPTTETHSTSAPICPHCGHEQGHDNGYFYDESLTDFECESCGKPIEVRVYTSTSWTCSVLQP